MNQAMAILHSAAGLKGHDAIACAREARVVASDLKWLDWERYSSRQGMKMKLGGCGGEDGGRRSYRDSPVLAPPGRAHPCGQRDELWAWEVCARQHAKEGTNV